MSSPLPIRTHVVEFREAWVQSLGQEDSPGEGNGNTPVFLPGESHGERSLAGTVHGVTESDTTEQLTLTYLG